MNEEKTSFSQRETESNGFGMIVMQRGPTRKN